MHLRFSLPFTKPVLWWNWLRHPTMTQMSSSAARLPLFSVLKGDSSASVSECKSSLMGVIEQQIIPRLLEAHPLASALSQPSDQIVQECNERDLKAFADICVFGTAEGTIAHVDQLLRKPGASHEAIFLGLIAPAARLLGTYWEEDAMDFTQVTLGLMRLQQVTHHLGYEYQDGPQKAGPVRRVMLASAPGSQHILGLAIVSEFFRKDGWQVIVEIAQSPSELCHAAQNEWFDLIGLSVGLVEQVSELPDLISRLRQSSRNPDTPVLLGGPAFLATDANAAHLGAIGISTDPLEALRLAAAVVDPTK